VYEFRVTVGMYRGGKQIFIASAEAGTKKETENQIRYLVKK
jgi:hypothetical protein